MTDVSGPESAPEEPHSKHKHSLFARMVDPLLASVPILVGVIVGALTSHFAEVQRVDFEREDRFRREQIERVAAIAHGYDSLAEPLNLMISAVETRKPGICGYMPLAQTTELRLQKAGMLHVRLFAPGQSNPNNTAQYGRELDAAAAQSPEAKPAADFLRTMISFYSGMLTGVSAAQAQFAQNREVFQATLMFETKVYFPDHIRKDVSATVNGFDDVERQTSRVLSPSLLCKLDVTGIRHELADLNVRSSLEMIAFAQALEPELNDSTIQR